MKTKKWNVIIIILSLVMLTCYVFIVDSPKNIFNALKSANIKWLFYALCCILLYWFFESLVLHYICNKLSNKISLVACFSTTMVGQLFNCITPSGSGGQPAQAFMLSSNNIPLGEASCVLLAKFIVYQITLTVYSLFTIFFKLPYFLNQISSFVYLVLFGFGIHILIVILLIGICVYPDITKKLILKFTFFLHKIKIVKNKEKAINKINIELDNFYQNFTTLKHNLKLLILPSVLTVIQLTVFFIIPYFVCLSLGISKASILVVICATAFVIMISSFVPIPGGAEGGFYLLFRIFFPTSGLLAIAIVLWRLFTFYLPILVGMLFAKFSSSKTIPE